MAIGILSGMAISYIAGSTRSASDAVARQQQVQLQSALDAWITAQSSGTAGLAGAKSAYTSGGGMLTNLAPYLRDPGIFTNSGSGLRSAALEKIGKTLTFSEWTDSGYPKVNMQ